MKMPALRNKLLRSRLGLILALLLAGGLALAQVAVAAHDAIHHAHAHIELCDTLQSHGNGAALLPAVVVLASPPLSLNPGCSHTATLATAHPWPGFHSRAPPR